MQKVKSKVLGCAEKTNCR